jgi:hypothetical protein
MCNLITVYLYTPIFIYNSSKKELGADPEAPDGGDAAAADPLGGKARAQVRQGAQAGGISGREDGGEKPFRWLERADHIGYGRALLPNDGYA